MRDHLRENVAADTLHSGWIHVDQHENSRLDTYDVTFDRPAQMATVKKTSKHGVQTKQFIASDPFGPLSGSMMALSLDLTPGKTYAFDVFGGSQRYVFSFDVQARERIHTVLGDFDALRIVPDVWYVSDGQLRSQAHGTMLWVSADKRHLPLRIQSQAFIGAVYADLIKVEDDGRPGGWRSTGRRFEIAVARRWQNRAALCHSRPSYSERGKSRDAEEARIFLRLLQPVDVPGVHQDSKTLRRATMRN